MNLLKGNSEIDLSLGESRQTHLTIQRTMERGLSPFSTFSCLRMEVSIDSVFFYPDRILQQSVSFPLLPPSSHV